MRRTDRGPDRGWREGRNMGFLGGLGNEPLPGRELASANRIEGWRPVRRTSRAFPTVLAFLDPLSNPLRPSRGYVRSTTADVANAVTKDLPRTHSLTVIVPTRNESGNVAPLIARLGEALAGIDAEVLFVDDSSDTTPEQVRSTAVTASLPVRLLHRTAKERVGGLGGAVLAGLRSAHGDWAVVMDGDLQHPPEVVPDLLRAGQQSGADLVVASRYVGAGSAGGLSTATRERVSGGANALARAVLPTR
jgi:hypothetical protein